MKTLLLAMAMAKKVFHNLNLHIKPGERLGIVGTSGAGKTTFVKCLLRYFNLQSGRILVDDQDIA
jgi:ABC-type multidrug transport system fused ATPase/permease subunit